MQTTIQNRARDELRQRLALNRFTHFVTLASNSSHISTARMDQLLKQWDQRMNRFLIGPRWHARPDSRMVWFAFLEKPETNPHWHLVIEADILETDAQRARLAHFALEAERTWGKIISRGSVDVQTHLDRGAIDYITKSLKTDVSWSMRTSLDFIRN